MSLGTATSSEIGKSRELGYCIFIAQAEHLSFSIGHPVKENHKKSERFPYLGAWRQFAITGGLIGVSRDLENECEVFFARNCEGMVL